MAEYEVVHSKTGCNREGNTLPLLTARDVAWRLQMSLSKTYRLMQQGKIPTVKIDRAERVREIDLEDYILNNLITGSNNKA